VAVLQIPPLLFFQWKLPSARILLPHPPFRPTYLCGIGVFTPEVSPQRHLYLSFMITSSLCAYFPPLQHLSSVLGQPFRAPIRSAVSRFRILSPPSANSAFGICTHRVRDLGGPESKCRRAAPPHARTFSCRRVLSFSTTPRYPSAHPPPPPPPDGPETHERTLFFCIRTFLSSKIVTRKAPATRVLISERYVPHVTSQNSVFTPSPWSTFKELLGLLMSAISLSNPPTKEGKVFPRIPFPGVKVGNLHVRDLSCDLCQDLPRRSACSRSRGTTHPHCSAIQGGNTPPL